MTTEIHTQPEQPDWDALCELLEAAREWFGGEDGTHCYDGHSPTAIALLDACVVAVDPSLFYESAMDTVTPAHTD